MPELGGEFGAEGDQRRPDPVQGLQHDGRPVGDERQHPVIGDLIGHLGPGATGAGIPRRIDHRPVLGQPQERRTEATAGQQLIDRVQVQQVAECCPVVIRRGQQRLRPPVRIGKLGFGYPDATP